MRIRAAALLVALLAAAIPAQAEFADVARALDKRLGKRMYIPMLGLGRMLVRIIEPQGVEDMQLAVFEDAPRVEGSELEALMQQHVGRGFTPLVRVRSHRESVFVYARPARNERTIELTVLTQDGGDTVLVRLIVDAETLSRQLGDGRKVTLLARGHAD